jgi:hypothetical protein
VVLGWIQYVSPRDPSGFTLVPVAARAGRPNCPRYWTIHQAKTAETATLTSLMELVVPASTTCFISSS